LEEIGTIMQYTYKEIMLKLPYVWGQLEVF